MVGTQGLQLTALLHPANIRDRDGAKVLVERMKCTLSHLRTLFADGVYTGQLVDWIVERTLAWLSQYRRHCREYERLAEISEAMIYVNMIRLILHRASKRKAKACFSDSPLDPNVTSRNRHFCEHSRKNVHVHRLD
ncbi:hypothetical protein ETAA8_68400 [Anatilimnocola aggregata]|uniref:Transposase IS4-like domain-containing protein n=1 Tax=Anatilimnocola aggregata TaxID=2528021 RepID=A0A517YN74_9BACT|nr:hypothetical protein ETAA8_68400 [Anatilimnocola aggregata]